MRSAGHSLKPPEPPYVWEAHGVFSAHLYSREECVSIVRKVRGLSDWEAAEINVAVNGAIESRAEPESRTASVLGAAEAQSLCEEFDGRVTSYIEPVLSEAWGLRLSRHAGTQLIRYQRGGHYLAHTDSGRDSRERYFTVLAYLNDDFRGGETSFPSLNYSATPAAGKAIVFPANFMHSAEAVTAGEKFILLSWLCGPAPIDWI